MVIDEINIDEREVTAHDVEGKHSGVVSFFLTEEEWKMRSSSFLY